MFGLFKKKPRRRNPHNDYVHALYIESMQMLANSRAESQQFDIWLAQIKERIDKLNEELEMMFNPKIEFPPLVFTENYNDCVITFPESYRQDPNESALIHTAAIGTISLN